MSAPGVARKGIDVAGGLIITGRETVIVNDAPIATEGDDVIAHGPHPNNMVAGHNAKNVFAEDRLVARRGDAAVCGHPITPGSADVFCD